MASQVIIDEVAQRRQDTIGAEEVAGAEVMCRRRKELGAGSRTCPRIRSAQTMVSSIL